MDFLMVNVPFFVADDLKEYNDQLEDPKKIANRLGELVRAVTNGISDPLVEPSFSITPFALGDTAVKYKVAACEGAKPIRTFFPGADFLRQNLTRHVDPTSGSEGCMELSVQFYADDASTPVEKGTATWREDKAPFTPIARITFPKQTFATPDRDRFC